MDMEIDLFDDDESVILVSGEEHRLQGNEHYKKLDYMAALDCYTAAINTEPDVALFYSNRSAANLMLHRYQDAYNDAKKACDLDRNNVKALIRLCKCQLILGLTDLAQNTQDTLSLLDFNNKDIKDQNIELIKYRENYSQFQSQYEKGDFRHALHCIENCIKVSHASLDLKLLRVDLLINLKRYTEAKDILENQVIDNKRSDNHVTTEALFLRGLCFYYLSHLDKAQSHFQHVLKLNPDHKKAQLSYKRCKKMSQLKEEGNNLVKTCQYEKARQVYSEGLLLDLGHDSMNAKLLFNRALTLLKVARYEEALADCDRALVLDRDYAKVWIRRVQCLMGLERWTESIAEAKRLMKQGCSSDEECRRLLQEAETGLKRSKQMNPYKVLGVSRCADDATIKKAYRKRALVHHPDRHMSADETTRKMEEIKFKEVNAAYSVVSDPRKRQMYDGGADIEEVLGNTGGGGCGGGGRGMNHADIFKTMFANGTGVHREGFHFQ